MAMAIGRSRPSERVALVTDTSLSGARQIPELDCRLIERGKPNMIVSENGCALANNAILAWADQTCDEWPCIAQGEAHAKRHCRHLR